MGKKMKGTLLLLLATVIWGSAFVSQSIGMDHVGPYTFQMVRCTMGALGTMPLILLFDRKRMDGKNFISRFRDKTLWLAGLLCGTALCMAANLQQVALVTTDAGKSGFLTAMYIVFVPIIGLLFRRKPSIMVPISVTVAVLGLYFLCFTEFGAIRTGDLLLLGCAVCFALQICFVDLFAPRVDALRLNCIQALVCAVGSGIIVVFTETPTISGLWNALLPMCHAGFLSMGLAYSFQILGQRVLDPAPAALIMSLESVFALLFGWMLLGERLSLWELLGCALVFAAVILSQSEFKKKKPVI